MSKLQIYLEKISQEKVKKMRFTQIKELVVGFLKDSLEDIADENLSSEMKKWYLGSKGKFTHDLKNMKKNFWNNNKDDIIKKTKYMLTHSVKGK